MSFGQTFVSLLYNLKQLDGKETKALPPGLEFVFRKKTLKASYFVSDFQSIFEEEKCKNSASEFAQDKFPNHIKLEFDLSDPIYTHRGWNFYIFPGKGNPGAKNVSQILYYSINPSSFELSSR